MEIKVDPMQQTVAATTTRQTQNTGEDFKFTLMSSLEEEGLQARLSLMMEDRGKNWASTWMCVICASTGN